MKPILFNTEMVRAILSGQKTTTRRIAKAKQEPRLHPNETTVPALLDDDTWTLEIEQFPLIFEGHYIPPYEEGDILYVREAWTRGYAQVDNVGNSRFVEHLKDDGSKYDEISKYYYRADFDLDNKSIKWHPSLHLPKSASRIFLKVKKVTLEHLSKITPLEIYNEGVCSPWADDGVMRADEGNIAAQRAAFKKLWDGTVNEKDLDRFGFDADPLVWVIEFEKIPQLWR